MRAEAGRIGGDVVLQRHRDVDQGRHGSSLRSSKVSAAAAQLQRRLSMPAYWLARSRVIDPIEYKKYTDLVPDIIARHGGKILARGGKFRIMEGPEKFQRFIVIEFPTFDQAVACFTSPEYDKAAAFRRNGAGEVENVIVEGVEGAP
jgi:uncharacterized protein (DUF1330 family)